MEDFSLLAEKDTVCLQSSGPPAPNSGDQGSGTEEKDPGANMNSKCWLLVSPPRIGKNATPKRRRGSSSCQWARAVWRGVPRAACLVPRPLHIPPPRLHQDSRSRPSSPRSHRHKCKLTPPQRIPNQPRCTRNTAQPELIFPVLHSCGILSHEPFRFAATIGYRRSSVLMKIN